MAVDTAAADAAWMRYQSEIERLADLATELAQSHDLFGAMARTRADGNLDHLVQATGPMAEDLNKRVLPKVDAALAGLWDGMRASAGIPSDDTDRIAALELTFRRVESAILLRESSASAWVNGGPLLQLAELVGSAASRGALYAPCCSEVEVAEGHVAAQAAVAQILTESQNELFSAVRAAFRVNRDTATALAVTKSADEASDVKKRRIRAWSQVRSTNDGAAARIRDAIIEGCGKEAAAMWVSDCQGMTYPECVGPDSVDLFVDWIRSRKGIDEMTLDGVDRAYEAYLESRQPLRDVACELMRRMRADHSRQPSEGPDVERLDRNTKERNELAKRSVAGLIELLSERDKSAAKEKLEIIMTLRERSLRWRAF